MPPQRPSRPPNTTLLWNEPPHSTTHTPLHHQAPHRTGEKSQTVQPTTDLEVLEPLALGDVPKVGSRHIVNKPGHHFGRGCAEAVLHRVERGALEDVLALEVTNVWHPELRALDGNVVVGHVRRPRAGHGAIRRKDLARSCFGRVVASRRGRSRGSSGRSLRGRVKPPTRSGGGPRGTRCRRISGRSECLGHRRGRRAASADLANHPQKIRVQKRAGEFRGARSSRVNGVDLCAEASSTRRRPFWFRRRRRCISCEQLCKFTPRSQSFLLCSDRAPPEQRGIDHATNKRTRMMNKKEVENS